MWVDTSKGKIIISVVFIHKGSFFPSLPTKYKGASYYITLYMCINITCLFVVINKYIQTGIKENEAGWDWDRLGLPSLGAKAGYCAWSLNWHHLGVGRPSKPSLQSHSWIHSPLTLCKRKARPPSGSEQGNSLLVFTPLCCSKSPSKALPEFPVWSLINFYWLRSPRTLVGNRNTGHLTLHPHLPNDSIFLNTFLINLLFNTEPLIMDWHLKKMVLLVLFKNIP